MIPEADSPPLPELMGTSSVTCAVLLCSRMLRPALCTGPRVGKAKL